MRVVNLCTTRMYEVKIRVVNLMIATRIFVLKSTFENYTLKIFELMSYMGHRT